jgi:kanamycin kinase
VTKEFSGPSVTDVTVPAALEPWVGVGVRPAVWVNEVGGLTFETRRGTERLFAKWAPRHHDLDLAAEAERLAWAAPYASVPEVVAYENRDDGEVLVTRALTGSNAVVEPWRSHPEHTVRALGVALRALHDALPVESCPFSWSIAERAARTRAVGDPARIAMLDALGPAPAERDVVVCHGDACAPNTLIGADGVPSGYVDLGRLGLADRWADIAVGAMSTEWNYGDGWTGVYYEAYGVEPDDERIAYYRSLWDAT